jgi:hypothetical protein
MSGIAQHSLATYNYQLDRLPSLRFLDYLAKQRALDNIDAENYGWEPDPDDPDSEINEEGSSRGKLPPEFNAIVCRISDPLRRMLV